MQMARKFTEHLRNETNTLSTATSEFGAEQTLVNPVDLETLLRNDIFCAEFGVDTAENEPSEVSAHYLPQPQPWDKRTTMSTCTDPLRSAKRCSWRHESSGPSTISSTKPLSVTLLCLATHGRGMHPRNHSVKLASVPSSTRGNGFVKVTTIPGGVSAAKVRPGSS